MRRATRIALAVLGAALSAGPALAAAPAKAVLEVPVRTATVGQRIAATIRVEAPPGVRVDPGSPASEIGPFTVSSGAWTGPVETAEVARWTWTGNLAAFETGALKIPAIEIRVSGPGGEQIIETEPVEVEVRSVLPAEGEGGKPPDLADLKPAASIAGEYRAVWTALLVLAGLLAASALAWWLHRRYAARFAKVAAPEDPFHRMSPHEWAYAELKRLLESKLAETADAGPFFSEVSRILKLYLGGRYRVDLMERTTEEVVPLLRQVGVAQDPARACRTLLESCDRVKFAREMPGAGARRAAVEEAYRIVDATRPVEQKPPEAAEAGAA